MLLTPTESPSGTATESDASLFEPRLWATIIFDLILLPLISYDFLYPFPIIDAEQLKKKRKVLRHNGDCEDDSRPAILSMKVWMADGLRLLLTPEGSHASLGQSEVSRRKTSLQESTRHLSMMAKSILYCPNDVSQ